MRSPAELTQAFRERGLKVTPQRQCIFGILHENEAHPTAESVYSAAVSQMPTISLRTVYQTLNDLAEMGEIHSLDVGTGSSRFDPNLEEHQHLVCDVCGRVRDIVVEVPATLASSAFDGFVVDEVQLVLRGRCADCQSRSAPNPPSEGALRHV